MSDALARPYDPWTIEERYTWVECPLPEYQGFSVQVRANLRNRDRKVLLDLIADVDTERQRLAKAATARLKDLEAERETSPTFGSDLAAMLDEMNRLQDQNDARVPHAIAPYVVGWNLQERDEQGGFTDAQPPSVVGPDAFDALEQPMIAWIMQSIIAAFRSGKGFPTLSPTPARSEKPSSASSEATSNAKQTGSRPRRARASGQSLPMPSPSTSTG